MTGSPIRALQTSCHRIGRLVTLPGVDGECHANLFDQDVMLDAWGGRVVTELEDLVDAPVLLLTNSNTMTGSGSSIGAGEA